MADTLTTLAELVRFNSLDVNPAEITDIPSAKLLCCAFCTPCRGSGQDRPQVQRRDHSPGDPGSERSTMVQTTRLPSRPRPAST
jgi:hypothetical protein